MAFPRREWTTIIKGAKTSSHFSRNEGTTLGGIKASYSLVDLNELCVCVYSTLYRIHAPIMAQIVYGIYRPYYSCRAYPFVLDLQPI